MQDSDTLIVPVVVANFDKQLCETVLTAEIKQPFRIRDVVDPDNHEAMKAFLGTLRSSYKTYLNEAHELTEQYLKNNC